MLNDAYEAMKENDNQINRNVVLALLDAYNSVAKDSGCYQLLKNAGDEKDVWIVAA